MLPARGAVALLDGVQHGWHDIQCGYLADVYSIRLAIPLRHTSGGDFRDDAAYITHAVLVLGLARLLAVEFDQQFLSEWLRDRYDVDALTGMILSGRSILDSLYHRDHAVSIDALRKDRRECCQKRDAWPTRPTEFEPFGVLDIELALRFPDEAEFRYPAIDYAPTEDEMVIRAMIAYHDWYA